MYQCLRSLLVTVGIPLSNQFQQLTKLTFKYAEEARHGPAASHRGKRHQVGLGQTIS